MYIYFSSFTFFKGSAPTAALFFVTYDISKLRLVEFENKKYLNSTQSQIVAANLGEIAACLLRVPVYVVKQIAQSKPNTTTFDVFKEVIKRDVWRIEKLLFLVVLV